MTVLGARQLNRATLARQLLLERASQPVTQVIEHLVGMQAQAPNAAYVGLWSRLVDFEPAELARLLIERRVVRTTLMRATIHLVTARGCVSLRPVVQPALERAFAGSPFAGNVADVDLDELLATGRKLLAERPRTRAELSPLLHERWPDRDADSLVYAVTYRAPLVQVPPRGVWGSSGPAAWAPVETWLDAPVGTDPTPDDVVLRYLAAFGPASVMDVQAWSGLTRLRPVVERLRPRLRVFTDERGRELFDLPEAPRPDADTPAPPRFLPEYDNVLLSHADRSRVIVDKRPVVLFPGNGAAMGNLLVDGFYRATWKITRAGDTATLTVDPFVKLSTKDIAEVSAEGERLLAFVAADVPNHEVVVAEP
ncbi:MAG TPA: winged helix DNA-binding domain-containing protein [Actinophytocola sp.]|uniref:winged helix DNA-binding domain-containing protein n=1 Tax=Actinophytocola sp. TaxID=1872138 RepID=UPI002DDDAEF8|nr:winged helix DNA-binding domain-containing protein [Actinophytocola sp.]HEV2784267.1 winged helix DNA-binding domain-containing protein [Actinophytocola sp.]